jgi:hypothetical protein
MTTRVTYTIRDYHDELSTFDVYLEDLTSANFDGMIAQIDALDLLIGPLTLGNIVKKSIVVEGSVGANTNPGDPYANNETKAKFFTRDNVTGKPGNFSIPAAALASISQQGTEELDLTLSVIAAFVSGIEATFKSRDGNPITVESARIATVRG